MSQSAVSGRPPFVFWSVLIGVGAAIPLVCIGVDVLLPSSGHLLGRDFAGFWAAGRLADSGHAAAAYSPQVIAQMMRPLGSIVQGFLYPPQILALLAPFGLLGYYPALATWTGLGCAAFVLAAKRHLPFTPLLALLTPAALLNIWDGQLGFAFGAVWFLAFSGDSRLSGVASGLAAFKPHLAVMLLPHLIANRRALLWAAVVAVLVSIMFIRLWGPFLAIAREQAAYVEAARPDSLFLRMMPGGYAAFGRSWPAHLIFAAAAAAVIMKYKRLNAFTLATASFLILPYAHNYDMTVACLGPAVLLWQSWGTLDTLQKSVLSAAYLAPELTFVVPWLVPPILLGCLVIQCRRGLDVPAQDGSEELR